MKLLTSLGVAFQALLLRLHRRLDGALLPELRFADQLAPAAAGAAALRADPALHATAAVGGDSIASLPRRVRSVRFDAVVPPTIDELLRVAPVPPPPPPPRRAQFGRRWTYVACFGAPCGGRAPSPSSYL